MPVGWVWCNLGFLFNHNTGKALNSSKTEGQALTYITTSNVYWDKLVLDNLKTMSFTDEEIVKCTVEKGDLLVCEGGDIGRSAIWESDEPIRIQNHLHRLRAYDKINTKFYYYVLYLYKLNGKINGNGIGLQGFSSNAVHSLIVPLPPTSEQERIVSQVESSFDIINEIDNNKLELDSYIEAVKSKILNLAVCGKLVPQDPTDEPASALLERIRAEKEELIKQGKIKRDKVESVIFKGEDNSYYLTDDEDISFSIPKSWMWIKHNDLFEISGGSQPPKSYFVDKKIDGYVRLFQIRDYGKSPQPVYIPESLASKQTDEGDILLARYGGSLGKVFKAKKGAYNVALAKVIFLQPDIVYKNFVFYYYKSSIYQKFCARMGLSRNAQSGFNKGDLSELYFPLPPLKEQIRIVKAIEDAFTIVDSIAENL